MIKEFFSLTGLYISISYVGILFTIFLYCSHVVDKQETCEKKGGEFVEGPQLISTPRGYFYVNSELCFKDGGILE